MRRHTTLVLLILATALGGCQSDGDRLIVPTPHADEFVALELTCIHATSIDDIIVGGFLTPLDGSVEGILLKTRDGGRNWRRIGAETHPFEGLVPQAIHFNDRMRGWVSGIRVLRGETVPVVIRTEDGGGHWRERQIPESRAAVVTNVSELAFKSDLEGKVHVVFFEDDAIEPTANIYKTLDGGRNWVIEDFAASADEGLTDASMISFSEKQSLRIDRPLENGTQVLQYTATAGKTWVPISQFHVTQFSQFYGYDDDSDAPGREDELAEERRRQRAEARGQIDNRR